MEGSYAIVGLPSTKFGIMVEAGFVSPGDLAYFDKGIIEQLSIKLSSKAWLKNYIKWRNQYLGFASDDLEYISVTPEELANIWQETMSGPLPGITICNPNKNADHDLKRRQTIANTQAIEAITEKLISKGENFF